MPPTDLSDSELEQNGNYKIITYYHNAFENSVVQKAL